MTPKSVEQLRSESIANEEFYAKIAGGSQQHVLTAYAGKIFNCDAREGVIDKRTEIVDIGKFVKASIAGSSGEDTSIDPFTEYGKTLIEEADKFQKKVDNAGFEPVQHIYGSSGPNLFESPYEVVRRTNYLLDVVGPSYADPSYFNAINAVNVRQVEQLNFTGYIKSAVVGAQKEIGDDVTPQPVRQAFTSYEKAIYADSMRYEFSMRDKKDSVFDIEAEMTADVRGAFDTLKDAKVTDLINAVSSSGDVSPDWDALDATHGAFTGFADNDVRVADQALRAYGGGDLIIMPQDTWNLYRRNVGGQFIVPKGVQSAEPPTARTGQLPMHEHLTYYINDNLTASTFAVINKRTFADHFMGPVLNISYKNSMVSGQVEDRIIFDFNGIKQKLAAGCKRYIGTT